MVTPKFKASLEDLFEEGSLFRIILLATAFGKGGKELLLLGAQVLRYLNIDGENDVTAPLGAYLLDAFTAYREGGSRLCTLGD